MGREFFQVDVFAPRPGAGNPLAVVLSASGLDEGAMQAIACWTNLAETTFVLPPSEPGASYAVRIFTTRQEIAFAGHPSIGTAHAVVAAGIAAPVNGVLIQQCRAGLLPVRVAGPDDPGAFAVRVPRSRIVQRSGDEPLLLAALGDRMRAPSLPALVEGGRRWWLAELADEGEVRSMRPDNDAIRALAAQSGSLGLCVFARCPDRDYDLVVRAFPLGVGLAEDPASGAANAAIAAFLDEAGELGTLGRDFRVSQGREMQRDAELRLTIDPDGEVWVGGRCHSVVRGTLDW